MLGEKLDSSKVWDILRGGRCYIINKTGIRSEEGDINSG